MDFTPTVFGNVELGTFQQTACSPAAPAAAWRGIEIAAPRQITITAGERPRVPICGYYLVPALAAIEGSPLTVRLRRLDTGAEIAGVLAEEGDNEPDVPPPEDAPEIGPEDLEGVSTGGYFNIDAQRVLTGELAQGDYEVWVSYAGTESNRLRVRIETR